MKNPYQRHHPLKEEVEEHKVDIIDLISADSDNDDDDDDDDACCEDGKTKDAITTDCTCVADDNQCDSSAKRGAIEVLSQQLEPYFQQPQQKQQQQQLPDPQGQEEAFRNAKKADPRLLFQDEEFPPLPSSIRGGGGGGGGGGGVDHVMRKTHQSQNAVKDTATMQPTLSPVVVKCRCRGSQPAKLAFQTKSGRPFYTCAHSDPKARCNYFSWAFTAELMHWYRFGRHTGHVLVGPQGFSASDLCQGRVGDCWFLSALAVVAERPDLIAKLFQNYDTMDKDFNSAMTKNGKDWDDGLVKICLFLDGYWKTIIVDNFLPCCCMNYKDPDMTPVATATTTATDAATRKEYSSMYNRFALADACQTTLWETLEYLHHQRQQQQQPQSCQKLQQQQLRQNKLHQQRMVASRDLAYSKAKYNQLWVPLLEKAYAKSHGCYSAISGGHIAEAFLDLTGAPTLVYDLQDRDFEPRSFWYKLLRYREQRLPMGCGTTTSAAGIIGMHAYSILDVVQVEKVAFSFFQETGVAHGNVSGFTDYDGTVRLLRIRNPHGKGEWRGDFSDRSEIWEKLLQHREQDEQEERDQGKEDKDLQYLTPRTMCNDGTFWIDYDNFLMGFSNVDVVLAFMGNHAKSFPSNFPSKKSNHRCVRAFEVSWVVDETTATTTITSTQSRSAKPYHSDRVELYIMGIQKTRRGASRGRADRKKSYKVCDLGVLVGEEHQGGHGYGFNTVKGEMFGFGRYGHYRYVLDRKRTRRIVVMPVSFGHPAATDKELPFVLRFVSDAPLLIRELEEVPRMDIALQKFCLGAPMSQQKQGVRKVLLEDTFYRLIQVDCRGNGGGMIFLYLCVHESMLQREKEDHHHHHALSFSVIATCRGMSCRTESGLLEHETLPNPNGRRGSKLFEAAWRRYSVEFLDEQKSRLLLVLFQSGQDTEFGSIQCKAVIETPKKVAKVMPTTQTTLVQSFFQNERKIDMDAESYTRRGIFNCISGNHAFDMAQTLCQGNNSIMCVNDYAHTALEQDTNWELEQALARSLLDTQYHSPVDGLQQDIEFQRVLELSKKETHHGTLTSASDEQQSSHPPVDELQTDIEFQRVLELSKKETHHGILTCTADEEESSHPPVDELQTDIEFQRVLELSIKETHHGMLTSASDEHQIKDKSSRKFHHDDLPRVQKSRHHLPVHDLLKDVEFQRDLKPRSLKKTHEIVAVMDDDDGDKGENEDRKGFGFIHHEGTPSQENDSKWSLNSHSNPLLSSPMLHSQKAIKPATNIIDLTIEESPIK